METEKKKKLTPGEQAAALEEPEPLPTPAAPTSSDRAGSGRTSQEIYEIRGRAKATKAAQDALVKEGTQTVGGPEDPAVVGLRHAKRKGYQPGLGGAGAFNAMFKTIYAGGQAGLTPEAAADLTLKKLGR